MTRPNGARTRRAVTLIELLVVMGLIALLAAMVVVITPGALGRDRVVAASQQLEGAMQLSRARALRDGLPRGVRLIWNGIPQVTEYQYVESPPVFVPNPGATLADAPYSQTGLPNPAPYVEFVYSVNPQGHVAPAPAPPARQCRLVGIHETHLALITAQVAPAQPGATLFLSLPLLGGWYTITGVTNQQARGTAPNQVYDLTVTLQSYPDAQLGATTRWRTYHFGIYGQPRVLLGEPTLQLPQKTCVDLGLSSPPGNSDYDIMFAPSGQLVSTRSTLGDGHVFLWLRDPDRPAPAPNNEPSFRAAGEQLVTVIKARSGAVGSAQVDWGPDPFVFARRAISGQ